MPKEFWAPIVIKLPDKAGISGEPRYSVPIYAPKAYGIQDKNKVDKSNEKALDI